MQDLPTAAELVEAVREFLEHDVFPVLEGRRRFHTRVAMNVLGIIGREMELGAAADAAERDRLAALLPGAFDGGASLLDANAKLASAIRTAAPALAREAVVAHLRATVRDKLAIANPGYLRD